MWYHCTSHKLTSWKLSWKNLVGFLCVCLYRYPSKLRSVRVQCELQSVPFWQLSQVDSYISEVKEELSWERLKNVICNLFNKKSLSIAFGEMLRKFQSNGSLFTFDSVNPTAAKPGHFGEETNSTATWATKAIPFKMIVWWTKNIWLHHWGASSSKLKPFYGI